MFISTSRHDGYTPRNAAANAARDAPRHAARNASRHAAGHATRHATRHATGHAPRYAAGDASRHASRNAPRNPSRHDAGDAPRHAPRDSPAGDAPTGDSPAGDAPAGNSSPEHIAGYGPRHPSEYRDDNDYARYAAANAAGHPDAATGHAAGHAAKTALPDVPAPDGRDATGHDAHGAAGEEQNSNLGDHFIIKEYVRPALTKIVSGVAAELVY